MVDLEPRPFEQQTSSGPPHALIATRADAWASEHCREIRHVRLRGVILNLAHLTHALLTSLDRLESVFVDGCVDQDVGRWDAPATCPETGGDYVDLMVDTHGGSLTGVGLGSLWRLDHDVSPIRQFWDQFFARLDELPNLNALRLHHGKHLKKTMASVLSDPRLDRLEELAVVTRTTQRLLI